MVEQRTYSRHDIGSLQVVAGGSVQCMILDVSLAGAKLSSEGYLPEKFYLMLRPDLKRWCKVIWRRRDQVGVRFIKDPTRRGDAAYVDVRLSNPLDNASGSRTAYSSKRAG